MLNRRTQFGYLLEVPLIAMVTAVVLAVVLPKLSGLPAKVVAALGAVVFLWVAHYMILRPGWQPNARPMGKLRSLLLFGLVATAIVGITGLFLFGAE